MTKSGSAEGARDQGIIPEGIWVLDQERSRPLAPTSHTLWIVKDDGRTLTWVSIESDAEGNDRITSWSGVYGGGPETVSGSGFIASVRALGPRSMEAFGEIPGMGPFSEKSEIQASGRKMLCSGEVEGPEGVQGWYMEYDLKMPSPHLPLKQAGPGE